MALFRSFGRAAKAGIGFMYDYVRYLQNAPWYEGKKDHTARAYDSVKILHSLEKSMSFPNRKPSSGWKNANLLADRCLEAKDDINNSFQDHAAVETLLKFIDFQDNGARPEAEALRSKVKSIVSTHNVGSGILPYTTEDLNIGRLSSPENFFLSRYTVRDFSKKIIDRDLVVEVIKLAMKSPSACNRQPWAIYYTDNADVIQEALKYQHGNAGFGHEVPGLFLCAVDLKAFKPSNERYQHWIDGGMFAMSIIYALHAHGVSSCCLNWSQHPKDDIKFRKAFKVENHHSIIMMLAAGYPNDNISVCASKRRPILEIYHELEKK